MAYSHCHLTFQHTTPSASLGFLLITVWLITNSWNLTHTYRSVSEQEFVRVIQVKRRNLPTLFSCPHLLIPMGQENNFALYSLIHILYFHFLTPRNISTFCVPKDLLVFWQYFVVWQYSRGQLRINSNWKILKWAARGKKFKTPNLSKSITDEAAELAMSLKYATKVIFQASSSGLHWHPQRK